MSLSPPGINADQRCYCGHPWSQHDDQNGRCAFARSCACQRFELLPREEQKKEIGGGVFYTSGRPIPYTIERTGKVTERGEPINVLKYNGEGALTPEQIKDIQDSFRANFGGDIMAVIVTNRFSGKVDQKTKRELAVKQEFVDDTMAKLELLKDELAGQIAVPMSVAKAMLVMTSKATTRLREQEKATEYWQQQAKDFTARIVLAASLIRMIQRGENYSGQDVLDALDGKGPAPDEPKKVD